MNLVAYICQSNRRYVSKSRRDPDSQLQSYLDQRTAQHLRREVWLLVEWHYDGSLDDGRLPGPAGVGQRRSGAKGDGAMGLCDSVSGVRLVCMHTRTSQDWFGNRLCLNEICLCGPLRIREESRGAQAATRIGVCALMLC